MSRKLQRYAWVLVLAVLALSSWPAGALGVPDAVGGRVVSNRDQMREAGRLLRSGSAVVIPIDKREALEVPLLEEIGMVGASEDWAGVEGAIATGYRLRRNMIEKWVITQTQGNLPHEFRDRDMLRSAEILSNNASGVSSDGTGITSTGDWTLADTRGTLTWIYEAIPPGDVRYVELGHVSRQWAFWINTATSPGATKDLWLVEDTVSGQATAPYSVITLSNANTATGTTELNGWSPAGNGGNTSGCTNMSYQGFSWTLCTSGYNYYTNNTGIGTGKKVWWNLQSPNYIFCKRSAIPNPTTWKPVTTFWTPKDGNLTIAWDHTVQHALSGWPCNSNLYQGFTSGSWTIANP